MRVYGRSSGAVWCCWWYLVCLGPLLLLLLLLVQGEASPTVDNVCANVCTCKWKGGKRTVECKPGVLNNIPDGIDPETQVLDVSDNDLGALVSNIFVKVRLTNLQRLYLRGCRISRIDPAALAGLTNLVELDLSHNRLSSVPSHSFPGVPFLRELVLGHNPLGYVPDRAFRATPNLVKLDLSSSGLADLAPKSFHGLEALEVLKLGHNRLATLKYPGTFEPLGKLTSLELHENPWICDCHLREMKSYLIKQNLPSPVAPVCRGPDHLANRSFAELGLDDFACPPVIQIVSRYNEATIGENASIVCQVSAIPPARIKWIWNGKLYANNNTAINGYQRVIISEEGLLFQKQSTLTLTNAQEADSSVFFCVAENQAGSVETNFTLHVSTRTAGMATLGSGQIAGISAALLVLILLILLTIMILFARLRRLPQPKEQQLTKTPAPPGNPDNNGSSSSPSTTTDHHHQGLANGGESTATAGRRKQHAVDDDEAKTTSFSSHLRYHSPEMPGAVAASVASRSPLLTNHHHHHHHQQHDYLQQVMNRSYEQQQSGLQLAGPCFSSTPQSGSLMPIDNPDLIRDTRRGSSDEPCVQPQLQYSDETRLQLYSECLAGWEQQHQQTLGRPATNSTNPYLMQAKDAGPPVMGYHQQHGGAVGGALQPETTAFPAGAKQIRVWQKGVPVLPPVSALKRVLSTRSSPDEGYQEGTGTDV
ncbi:leucine-rich repeat-containing protein 24-like [Copidosoma floridanum]|uniref:leucine-rich repeat-containing protein 24-like n=1 Tax=Copidosoma floridanum TaxID=29053 RepID=UPI0006C9CD52|nr:leucine-rich repeat-containing protein 24-like [Copidosoma floridanum]